MLTTVEARSYLIQEIIDKNKELDRAIKEQRPSEKVHSILDELLLLNKKLVILNKEMGNGKPNS